MHTYDVTARGRALAGGTRDVIGCHCGDRAERRRLPTQTGTAEQMAAGEAVDGRCRRGVNGDRTGTRTACLLT